MALLKVEIKAETRMTAEGRDVKGRVIQSFPFRECNSLLEQFIQLLRCQCSQEMTWIRDITGVEHEALAHVSNFAANAGSLTTHGIVIGSGEANPVAQDDYRLEAQITTDVAHNTPTFVVESTESGKWELRISRGFVNNTGAQVNVKEVGLYVIHGTVYKVCADRTLYSVSFGDGVTLTLTYKITISL